MLCIRHNKHLVCEMQTVLFIWCESVERTRERGNPSQVWRVWFISLFILMKNTVDMHIYKYKYVYIRSINKWVCLFI